MMNLLSLKQKIICTTSRLLGLLNVQCVNNAVEAAQSVPRWPIHDVKNVLLILLNDLSETNYVW